MQHECVQRKSLWYPEKENGQFQTHFPQLLLWNPSKKAKGRESLFRAAVPSQGRAENHLNEQTWKDPDGKADAQGLKSTSLQKTQASAQILLKENGNRILQVH